MNLPQNSTRTHRPLFAKSVVIDEHGLPLLVYRGEHGVSSGFIHTRLPSISFGSCEAANFYALEPNNRDDQANASRVIPAFLLIENPVFVNDDDPFVDISLLVKILGLAKAEHIARKLAEDIEYTGNWMEDIGKEFESVAQLLDTAPHRINDLYLNAYRVFDDPECIAWLKEAGFDGAIHLGNGVTATEAEYRVFDASQIIPAIGTTPAMLLGAVPQTDPDQDDEDRDDNYPASAPGC